MTARILLCSRMGVPCLLLDLRALRRVSATEWLIVDGGGQWNFCMNGGGGGRRGGIKEYRARRRGKVDILGLEKVVGVGGFGHD